METFTVEQLAERWNCNKVTIYRFIKSGGIRMCKNTPIFLFPLSEVLRCEAVGDLEPLSPAERARLERNNQELKKELQKYQNFYNSIKKGVEHFE